MDMAATQLVLADGYGHFSIEALVIPVLIARTPSVAPMSARPALTVHRQARRAVDLFDEAVKLSS